MRRFAFLGVAGASPKAALEPSFLPDMRLHIEARARELAVYRLELEVPAPNEMAIRQLLSRRFRIDPWFNIFMSSQPFGSFDRYVGYGPPMIL